jgi:hypothetical protein
MATIGFLDISLVTFLKRDNPIRLIAGATVRGVMNLTRNPMNP